MKQIHLYGQFIKSSLKAQMEYRLNFIISIVAEFFWVISHLLYMKILYETDALKDMPKESLFLFCGVYLIITGIFMSCFFTNFSNVSGYIRDGQLDLLITKPVSLQAICSLRYFDFGYPVADLVVGIILIFLGIKTMEISFIEWNIAGFILYLLFGIVWMYILQILPALLSFYTVKVGGVYSFSYSLHDMNKIPMNVYQPWIQRIGTFLYPLFPMSNYPVLCLLGKLEWYQAIWGVIGPMVGFFLVKIWWDSSIKRYSSASC